MTPADTPDARVLASVLASQLEQLVDKLTAAAELYLDAGQHGRAVYWELLHDARQLDAARFELVRNPTPANRATASSYVHAARAKLERITQAS